MTSTVNVSHALKQAAAIMAARQRNPERRPEGPAPGKREEEPSEEGKSPESGLAGSIFEGLRNAGQEDS